jgi:pyrimidine deaminase RibD-like protein
MVLQRDPEILDRLSNDTIAIRDKSVCCINGYERTKPLNYGILLETREIHKDFQGSVLRPVRKLIKKDMCLNTIFSGDQWLLEDVYKTDPITLMVFMMDPQLCLHYLQEITLKLEKLLCTFKIEIQHLKKIGQLSQALTTKALLYFYIWKHSELINKVELLHAVKPREDQLKEVEKSIYIGNSIRHLVAVLLGKLNSSTNHRSPMCHAKIYTLCICQLQKLEVNPEDYGLLTSEEVMEIAEAKGYIPLIEFFEKKRQFKSSSSLSLKSEVKEEFLKRAIELALLCKPEDYSKIRPKVGAVIVKNGKIIAEGYRNENGKGCHAEAAAINKCKGENLEGAILITTMEPCTVGDCRCGDVRMPCAALIAHYKIKGVIWGTLDPNRRIKGEGIKYLQDNGILTESFPAYLIVDIKRLNERYFKQFPPAKIRFDEQ